LSNEEMKMLEQELEAIMILNKGGVLDDASARQLRADVSPKYLLRHPSFLGGQYRLAGEIVEWGGEPHADMEPMNPAAEERLTAWREELPPAMHGPGDFPWRTTIGGRPGG
jgi:hypothetical protein